MCGGGDAPQPADPGKTAEIQAKYNLDAYRQTMAGNAMNQSNPYGNLTYESWIDPTTGQTRYSATQTLSKENQGLLNSLYGTKGIAGQQASNVLRDAYTGAPNIVGTADSLTQQALGAQLDYLKPFFTQQTNQLDNQLRNQGLMPGTEAYDNAMNTMRQNQGQTVSGAIEKLQPQAFQQALASYQLPAQMAQTLSSLGAPIESGVLNTPQGSLQASNYQGAVQAADAAKMEAYKADQAAQAQMIGGLMQGVGSMAGMAMMSDRRMKTEITQVGSLFDGTPVYRFRYRSGGPMQIGLMAQDVELTAPDAVIEVGPVKFVDYRKATERAAAQAA